MADRTVKVRLRAEVDDFVAGFKKAGSSVKDFKGDFDRAQKAGTAGTDELAQGALAMGGAILLGFGMAAKASMAFEKEMSAVGSASGATKNELNQLREAAMQAGKDTAFSAREAAQGETELAKAGVAVKDILGGGLKGALDLAAAGQIGVAESAEIAATAMTQFKLKGDAIPHLADLLSAGANKAQGGVDDLGMALKQGGLVASQFGLSIDETVGTLTAFASAGLLGSDAGTSLKTTLLMLGNPTEKSAALMKELGINAYDAAGNFVGMAALAGQLRSQLSGLTQEQRNAALAQIFGADAVRAANVLYQNGAEGIKKWTSEVNDAGNASRTAAEKTNNLAGDLERLQGTFETALIQAGSQGTGALRTLTQAADNTITGFTTMPSAMQSVVVVLGLVVGGALAAAGAYGVMAPKIREASAALVGMGTAGRMANTALVGMGKGVGVALLALSAMQIAGAAMSNTTVRSSGDIDRLGRSLTQFGRTGQVSGEMVDVLGGRMGRLNNDLKALERDGFAGAATGFGSAIEKITMTGNAFDDSIQNSMRRISEIDTALAELVKSGHADEAAGAFRRISEAGKDQGVNLQELQKAMPQYTSAAKDVAEAATGAGEGMATSAEQAKTLAGGMASAVAEAGSLAEALSGLNDVNMNAAEAGASFKLSLLELGKELRDNKSAWNENTVAGLENQQAMRDRIKLGQDALAKQWEQTAAVRGEAAANAEATKSHASMRASMINTAVAAGINRAAVTALVDALFRVPKDVRTNVSAPGATTVAAQLANVEAERKKIKDAMVKVSQQGGPYASQVLAALASQMRALDGQRANLSVVTTYSYRGARPAVQTGRNVIGSNLDRSRWGNIYSYAAGGLMQAKVAPPGTLIQWAEPETGGEAYIPRRGDASRSKAILAEAASWYGGQVSFSGGPGMGATSMPGGSSGNAPVIHNHFYIDGQEIRGISRQEAAAAVTAHDSGSARQAMYGRR